MMNEQIIPNSISFIGKIAFYKCDGFDKLILNSERILASNDIQDNDNIWLIIMEKKRKW